MDYQELRESIRDAIQDWDDATAAESGDAEIDAAVTMRDLLERILMSPWPDGE